MRAAELERQQHSAAITIALQRSKRAIEAKIRARGHKVSHYSARDLRVMAEAHFEQHRAELLADARTTVEQWTAEGFFGKRAQRAYAASHSTISRLA